MIPLKGMQVYFPLNPISLRREVYDGSWFISSWTLAITPLSLFLFCSDISTCSGAISTIFMTAPVYPVIAPAAPVGSLKKI